MAMGEFSRCWCFMVIATTRERRRAEIAGGRQSSMRRVHFRTVCVAQKSLALVRPKNTIERQANMRCAKTNKSKTYRLCVFVCVACSLLAAGCCPLGCAVYRRELRAYVVVVVAVLAVWQCGCSRNRIFFRELNTRARNIRENV